MAVLWSGSLHLPDAPGDPANVDEIQRTDVVGGGAAAHRPAAQSQGREEVGGGSDAAQGPGVFTKNRDTGI